MPFLKNYQQFTGIHWETGTLHNYLSYRKFYAPHTNKPYSEAVLMGISGGIVMGYFSFSYKGYDPHVALLTRNTFQPWNTIIDRLHMVEETLQTTQSKKALKNLVDTLKEDIPVILWADAFSLSYNAYDYDENNWAVFPLIVYGYDEKKNQVQIADGCQVPLIISSQELETARARVKKIKNRIAILDMPDESQFKSAIQKGIWDCIKLYTEPPPRGSKHNFGLAAFKKFADLLTKPTQKMSWAKVFPKGGLMYCGLKSTFNRIALFGQTGEHLDAERTLYAQFLEEASLILHKPSLKNVAEQFKESAKVWKTLALSLLPDKIEPFKQTKWLMIEKNQLFRQQGQKMLPRIQEINLQLQKIREEIDSNFPLKKREVNAMLHKLQKHILEIHDIEKCAILNLQKIMTA